MRRLLEAFGAALLLACSTSTTVASAPESPTPPLRPAGIFVESVPAMPVPAWRADHEAIALLRPVSEDGTLRTFLRDYVRAFAYQDLDFIAQHMAIDAVQLGSKGGVTKDKLIPMWRERLRIVDYTHAIVPSLNDIIDVTRIAEYSDFEDGSQQRPQEMLPGDLWVWLPFPRTPSNSKRYFCDALTLIVRRYGDAMKIAAIAEANAPPEAP